MLFFESDVVRRITLAQAKKHKPVDIFETIPLFAAIDDKKDRADLKKVLIEERYEEGDVLFDYGTYIAVFAMLHAFFAAH